MITSQDILKTKGLLGVYKITNPKNKIYIGSGNLYERYKSYRAMKSTNPKKQYKIYNSIIKYGWQNHRFEIICVDKFENLFFWENYFGTLYDTVKNGLNLRLPSSGEIKAVVSEELKDKYRKAMLGNTFSVGRKKTEEEKKICSEASSRKKTIINKDTGEEYLGVNSVSKLFNIKNTRLLGMLTGELYNTSPFYYKGEEHRVKWNKPNTGKKVINIQTKEIYNSIKDAAESIGKNKKYLQTRLSGYTKNDSVFRDLSTLEECNTPPIKTSIVLNIETGIYYEDLYEAAKTTFLTASQLNRKIWKDKSNFIYTEPRTNKRKVININTNIIYNSIKECAKALNISEGHLGVRLKGNYINNTTIRYYGT